MLCVYMAYINVMEVNVMNLKLAITIMILMITVVFPSVAGSTQVIDKQVEVDKNGLFVNDTPIFIKGRISNVTLHQHSYMVPYWTFNCEDVNCIFSFRDRPLIHHLTNKEQFILPSCGPYYYKFSGSNIIAFIMPIIWFYVVLYEILYEIFYI